MNKPKRHHWWPQLHSGYWCDTDGKVYVWQPDRKPFRTAPVNIGVEGHLYSTFDEYGERDPAIEEWLANEIDGPFDQIFSDAFDIRLAKREPFQGNPQEAATVKELGYVVRPYREYISLRREHRDIISSYVAALLVRNPFYLRKLEEFHERENKFELRESKRNAAIHNMIYVYDIYKPIIRSSHLLLTIRDCDNEFIFADAGIVAQEPWGKHIPFDIHVPLTPDISLQVFPLRDQVFLDRMFITRAKTKAVGRHNRIVLGHAKRFVFTRGFPPEQFLKKYFGVPPPKAIGHRYLNGRLEVRYDRHRDHL